MEWVSIEATNIKDWSFQFLISESQAGDLATQRLCNHCFVVAKAAA